MKTTNKLSPKGPHSSLQRPGNPPVLSPPSSHSPRLVKSRFELNNDETVTGILELHPKGFGYLRDVKKHFVRYQSDPFVSKKFVSEFGLREGVLIRGKLEPNPDEDGPTLAEIIDVEGIPPQNYIHVKAFDQMVPIKSNVRFRLETGRFPLATRVIDFLSPLGMGKRGLIIAPSYTEKNNLIHQISFALNANYPYLRIITLFVDVRIEDVTDFQRTTNVESAVSSLKNIEDLVRNIQLLIQRCQRLVEMGNDVLLLIDSFTSLVLGINEWHGRDERFQINHNAINMIREKLLSLSNVMEEGGSLTLVGTLKTETGNLMDNLVLEEFRGSAHSFLHLDRRLADLNIWPAINVIRSRCIFEEKFLTSEEHKALVSLRKEFRTMYPDEAMDYFLERLAYYETNDKFIKQYQ